MSENEDTRCGTDWNCTNAEKNGYKRVHHPQPYALLIEIEV